jgi:photosystem II stability/assembly factor-like uncharacterized protein
MPNRTRFVAVVAALSLVLAVVGPPLSASAIGTTVAGISMAPMLYSGEPVIPGSEGSGDIQVYTAFNAVDMLDANSAWAVGWIQNDAGNIQKRQFVARITGGGSTIATAEVSPDQSLNGVSAVDSTHVWAVGTGAQILKWSGGSDLSSWAAQAAPAGTTVLDAVDFADASNGFAVGAGGRIAVTTDGSTWSAAALSPATTNELTAVKAISSTNAWAVGKAGCVYQLSGGTWQARTITGLGTTDLYAVDFFDANHGVIVGVGSSVFVTRDGGATWAKHTTPAPPVIGDPAAVNLHSVRMTSADTIVAGGNYGTVLRSTDGGGAWQVGQADTGALTSYDWQINGLAVAPTDATKLLFAGQGPGGSQQCDAILFSGTQPAGVPVKPAAPTGLTAVAGGPTLHVDLAWTANAGNETGYRVKRTDNGGPLVTVVDGLAPGTHAWTDPGVVLEHVYVYSVFAYNAAGESDPATKAVTPTAPTPMPVWRFYNFRTGTHFYTADPVEKNNVAANMRSTYSLDGVAYTVNTSNSNNSTPLYRFYNLKTGTHFYTADAAEKTRVETTMASTYHLDGIAYNVCSTNVTNAITVWRFYNFKTGTHFYTADAAEKANVQNNMKSTYSLDGPGFYLAP